MAGKIAHLFPPQQRNQVRSLLKPFQPRVQLCILKLSEGSMEKLTMFVDSARQDYRDVMIMVEFPNDYRFQITNIDEETPRAVYDQDLQQYLDWVHETG